MKVCRDTALDGPGAIVVGVGDGQAIELWFLVAPLGDVTGRVKECHESLRLLGALPRLSLGQSLGARPDLAGWRQCGRWGDRARNASGMARCTDCGLLILDINSECSLFPPRLDGVKKIDTVLPIDEQHFSMAKPSFRESVLLLYHDHCQNPYFEELGGPGRCHGSIIRL